jgi:CspA family cold shock protein
MEKGIIRWFDNKKGYGFIEKASDGKDLFVHYSAITMEGYKTLKAKEEVEFDVVDGDKGPQAADVKRSGTVVAEAPKEAEEEAVEVTEEEE